MSFKFQYLRNILVNIIKRIFNQDLKNIQGMTAEDILMTFYDSITFKRDKFGWSSNLDLSFYKGKGN